MNKILLEPSCCLSIRRNHFSQFPHDKP